jgi:hypothetical protein
VIGCTKYAHRVLGECGEEVHGKRMQPSTSPALLRRNIWSSFQGREYPHKEDQESQELGKVVKDASTTDSAGDDTIFLFLACEVSCQ